ncbi:pentapeptide repeat-containing protein [Streptomyces sp. Wb2n-11]|uniref:pentapeptide repeat-containing protein n=1 Tax=Streptomyces sp. Wb2n-11 TaxID=1030533 RepID=UPI000B88216C|nr:pentapeptide repeat-containing protein [Streptomyces sp. Wb2n-11]
MPYRRRQQLHRVARRATQPGRPNPIGRHLSTAPLPSPSPAAARPVPPRAPRADAVGEPERDGATSSRQGLDWARRTELIAVVLGVLLSPLIAAAGIWYSNNQVRDQLKISSQELNVTQEGQITDRYTKAVESLDKKAMDVRLGGIYALQRIMEDSPRDHPTIANVLATYIRTHTDKASKDGEVSADVHAALTVLAYRDTTRDKFFYLDLRHTHLSGIELQPRFRDVKPKETIGVLSREPIGAKLTNANLTKADLTDAHLPYAELSGANLIDADLIGAKLIGADLIGAKLIGADLIGADLTHARGLQVREVISAVIDSTTKLPSALAKDPAVTARIAEVESN